MAKVKCPGSIRNATPTPIDRKCHNCGCDVEMWSDEEKADCPKCGTTIFKDKVPTCVEWCSSAEECMGDILDVKKIKEDARKRAEKDGDPKFVEKVSEMIKKKREEKGCDSQ